jgi:hypothetical protein
MISVAPIGTTQLVYGFEIGTRVRLGKSSAVCSSENVSLGKDEERFLYAPFEAHGKQANTFAGANLKGMASVCCVRNDGGWWGGKEDALKRAPTKS